MVAAAALTSPCLARPTASPLPPSAAPSPLQLLPAAARPSSYHADGPGEEGTGGPPEGWRRLGVLQPACAPIRSRPIQPARQPPAGHARSLTIMGRRRRQQNNAPSSLPPQARPSFRYRSPPDQTSPTYAHAHKQVLPAP